MPKTRIQWAIAIILVFLAFSTIKNGWDIYATDNFPETTGAIKDQEEGLRKLQESYKEAEKASKETDLIIKQIKESEKKKTNSQ